jgi:hypothetical protein
MSESEISKKIEEIKKRSPSKVEYKLTYDSMMEGLEPIYFWILDFLKDSSPSGLGFEEIIKQKDEYDATVSSGYFGEMGTRRSVMEDRAMKIMATVNTVIRSIINLIYDLKEFEIRLAHYDDLHSSNESKKEGGRLVLKQIWMDQVDIKKGRGAINAMAQQLEFVTLRDAFIASSNESTVDKLDLNDRVRRIVKARIAEYLVWEKNSEKELRKRYDIEKAYLKSQVASLKHYTSWVKPYLISAKKLGMTEFKTPSGQPSPNLVNAFSNMEMHLVLFAKSEIKPEKVNSSYQFIKFKEKYFSCIEVDIQFRTLPRAYQGQGGSHYVHSGRTDIIIKPYALTEKEIEEIYTLKEKEDLSLIEEMTDASLTVLYEDIEKYLMTDEDRLKKAEGDEKIKLLKQMYEKNPSSEIMNQIHDEEIKLKRKKAVAMKGSFGNVFMGFKQVFEPIRVLFGMFNSKQIAFSTPEKKIRDEASDKAEKSAYVLYDIYKKAHGMTTW